MRFKGAQIAGLGTVCGAVVAAAVLIANPSTREQLHDAAYALGIHRPVPKAAIAGDPFPPMQLADVSGAPVDVPLASRGTVVYNIFASWCGPCNEEAPSIAAAARTLSRSGVRFIGIDQGEDGAHAASFAQTFHLAYPMLLDASNLTRATLNAKVIPETVIVRDGIVDQILVGPLESTQLVRMVEGA
jgi:thiol-disulfide isomerase/thioredoxin